MACQPEAPSGAAPANLASDDISACLPESVGRGSLVTKDQREVCTLAGGVMLWSRATQPLSALLQDGFRLLPPPLPALPSASLASRFPERQRTVIQGEDGLTTLRF